MKSNIVAFGNTGFNAGFVIAADLALAGYDVSFVDLPESTDTLTAIKRQGGIFLDGNSKEFVSGKTGLAKLSMVTSDLEKGLADADIIFVDALPHEYETRIQAIAPYLKDNQIIHFSGYGYWSALRVAKIIKKIGKKITITESKNPYRARNKEGKITCGKMRTHVPLGVFPSIKNKETLKILKEINQNFELTKNVLQIYFENINLMIHPGMSICNIGGFDNAKDRGEGVDFYKEANTIHTGRLLEAQDKERTKICQAYNIQHQDLKSHIIQTFDVKEEQTFHSLIKNNKIMQGSLLPADIWIKWVTWDIPLAGVPLVALADLIGVSTPIHKALISIIGSVLEADFWKTGITLNKLGLENLTSNEVIQYVTYGTKS